MPYDPVKDFTPVAMVVDFGPQMLSVNADLPVKTVAELIAYAKANPGKLSYAVDVTAGAAPFAARLLNKRANLGMVEVPYRSAAQMAQDVASGTIPVLISSMAASNGMVQAGKIRRIALSSTNRFPPLPDLPTIGETVPGVTMDGWFVVVAPAGAPRRRRDADEQGDRRIPQGRRHPQAARRISGSPPAAPARRKAPPHIIASEQARWRALGAGAGHPAAVGGAGDSNQIGFAQPRKQRRLGSSLTP